MHLVNEEQSAGVPKAGCNRRHYFIVEIDNTDGSSRIGSQISCAGIEINNHEIRIGLIDLITVSCVFWFSLTSVPAIIDHLTGAANYNPALCSVRSMLISIPTSRR